LPATYISSEGINAGDLVDSMKMYVATNASHRRDTIVQAMVIASSLGFLKNIAALGIRKSEKAATPVA